MMIIMIFKTYYRDDALPYVHMTPLLAVLLSTHNQSALRIINTLWHIFSVIVQVLSYSTISFGHVSISNNYLTIHTQKK